MLRGRLQLIGFAILPLWCTGGLVAANLSPDVSQYAHTAWKVRDGLIPSGITALTQDHTGYLWLGTQSGIWRFDGIRVLEWRPPQGETLPDDWIASLYTAPDGTVWIGTRNGVASWDGIRFLHYPELDGFGVYQIIRDREGTFWMAAYRDPSTYLCTIREGHASCDAQAGKFGEYVHPFVDHTGNVWATGSGGVWQFSQGQLKQYELTSASRPHSLSETPDGQIIVASDDGLKQLVDGRFQSVPFPIDLRQWHPDEMLRDRRGALWISTENQGLLHFHQGRLDFFDRTDGLSGHAVHTPFEDMEGNVWVTTEAGLDRFTALAAITYSIRQGVQGNASAVAADREGNVWFTAGTTLYEWREGKMIAFQAPTKPMSISLLSQQATQAIPGVSIEGLPAALLGSLLVDHRGRVWVGTRSTLGYFDKRHFVSVTGIGPGPIFAMAEDREGGLWIAQYEGLLRRTQKGEIQRFPWPEAITGWGVPFAVDPADDTLWIGSYSGAVWRMINGKSEKFLSKDAPAKGPVTDIHFGTDGTVWISSQGGLVRVKSGRASMLTTKDGLPCSAVHAFAEGDDGSAWLYAACGLVHIPASELAFWNRAADEGKSTGRKLRMTVIGSSEGIRNSKAISSWSPHIAKDSDGRIWLVAEDGITVVDPRNLELNNRLPPVHVEEVIADRVVHQGDSRLHLPPRVRDLEIRYTALSLAAPEKVQFRYKLEGHDHDWRSVGTRRQAFYTDLPPGDYRFRVIASNNSGVWNMQGASLDFSITPAYWQTAWFRALCVVAILAFLWMLYWLRLRQVARNFERTLDARVAERTRIARDLHDTLLQSFNSLVVHLAVVSRRFRSQPDEAQKTLDETIDQARRAIREGREAVQGLRSSTEEPNDLAQAISRLAEDLSRSTSSPEPSAGNVPQPIDIQIRVEGESRRLHPIIRDEMYRIAAEALRNALQHSQATQIEVELRYDPRQFRLQVRDDGRGIEKELATGGREGHFGLKGMRERAELAGGKLTVWSAPGSGTEVEVNIPASRAYASARSGYRRDSG